MMDSTLFCVELPATAKSYDFWVPDDMTMQEASRLIGQAMQMIEPDHFLFTGTQALMYRRTGQIQDPAATVSQIGFVDGEQFVLV